MNKIIPFNKEIKFNESIGEITSILIDDTLEFKDSYNIIGDLIVKGSHKYGDIEEDCNLLYINDGGNIKNNIIRTNPFLSTTDINYYIHIYLI